MKKNYSENPPEASNGSKNDEFWMVKETNLDTLHFNGPDHNRYSVEYKFNDNTNPALGEQLQLWTAQRRKLISYIWQSSLRIIQPIPNQR